MADISQVGGKPVTQRYSGGRWRTVAAPGQQASTAEPALPAETPPTVAGVPMKETYVGGAWRSMPAARVVQPLPGASAAPASSPPASVAPYTPPAEFDAARDKFVATQGEVKGPGQATGGFSVSEPLRATEEARVSARTAFAKERDKEENLATMRKDASQMAASQAQGLTSKDIFDAAFVGKADESNPSFRNAMAARRSIDGRVAGESAQLGQLNKQIADAEKHQPVGGQMYNQQDLVGEQARANIDATLGKANLENAQAAASGFKGTGHGDGADATKDVAALAARTPAEVALAVNANAAIKKGGTGETFTIPDEKGNPQTMIGTVTAEQKAGIDADIANLSILKRRKERTKFNPLNWNMFSGNTDKYNEELMKTRQRISRVAAPAGTATK